MSVRTICPSCEKVYHLDEAMQGKTVRCRECQASIPVPALGRRERGVDGSRRSEERIATSSRPARAAGRADRDDEGPRRRPAERRSRREDEETQGGKNWVLILLGVGVAALVLVGLAIGGVVLVVRGTNGSNNQSAAVTNEQTPAPIEDRVAPLAAPAAVPVPVAGPAAVPPAGPMKEAEAAVPAGPVPSEMAAAVVKKVKKSTAYLRVSRPSGEVAQGSGFFALERGIVITNAHVVGMLKTASPPRSVDVVIHSGEADEAKLTGTIVGLDRENDLAVLRVDGDPSRLPPPLPVATATKLTETQNVYIFGFPFGAQLGKDITVSASSVGALRRSDGVLKQVQVNGGMHPGNSGGPVTDARGVVVGVCVAGLVGTQINFAIPADFIRPLVERSKSKPLDRPPPGPLARNDPPAGPAPGAGLEGDLAALKGTWQSGPVSADDGTGRGTVKLSISPGPGSLGGRVQVEIATQQAGRTSSSRSTYSFTLRQQGDDRLLVTQVSRRGRGLVFVYRFDGDQLVLSGKVASVRLAYTLKNVALRRTSADPEPPPAANPVNPAPGNPAPPMPPTGGGGKGSPDALKFSGDVFVFVEAAVREKRLADVDIRGFTLGKPYREVCAEGGVLIGFQAGLGKFGSSDIVRSLRPIFLTKNGEKLGSWQGPIPEAPITIKAKPGYVVSGLSVRTALAIDALTVTFAKLGKEGLDLSDTYNSEVAGGNGGRPSSIGGRGALFVGITGHLGGDGAASSLGLVAVLPKD
jgi:S1-C subfamily serine protease